MRDGYPIRSLVLEFQQLPGHEREGKKNTVCIYLARWCRIFVSRAVVPLCVYAGVYTSMYLSLFVLLPQSRQAYDNHRIVIVL
jgi:hypothetical protein